MSDNRVQEIKDFYKNVMEKLIAFQNSCAEYRALEQDEESINHNKIPDLCLSMYLLKLDITICHKHLLIYKQQGDVYEMNYFTRALATHWFDLLDTSDSSKIINRVKEISKIHYGNEETKLLAIELEKKCKSLQEIKTKNLPLLKSIRNNMFAHRDGKGIEQFDALNQIDEKHIALMGADSETIIEQVAENLLQIQKVLFPDYSE